MGRLLACRINIWRPSGRTVALLSALATILFALQWAGAKAAPHVEWIQFRNGRLIYGTDEHGNRIPDFSTVGYEGGRVIIPDVAVRSTLDPLPSGDDTPRIQAAIAALANLPLDANGFRGALLLHAGTYRIAGTIELNASGIILRGDGDGENGTILVAQGAPHTIIHAAGDGGWQVAGPRHAILDQYVPIGASAITVEDDQDLKVGDRIIVEWRMDATFIHAIGMDRIPPRRDGGRVQQWEPGMALKFDRRIVAVEHTDKGERVSLDAPLTTGMYRSEGPTAWRYVFPGRIAHAGIENLRSDGSEFEKIAGGAFDSIFVSFDCVENAWIRNVAVTHYPRIVSIDQFARAVTAEHIRGFDIHTSESSAAPHAFGIDGEQNLVEDCNITGSNNHVWMTQSRVAGPNVFRESSAKGDSLDAGPHMRWATGTLYEELHIQGAIKIQNRSNMGTGHGWAGANNVLWNCEAESFILQSPAVAYNWAFGMKGSLENSEADRRASRQGSSGDPEGQNISPGKHVEPESLYKEQLKERLQEKQDPRK
jgi:hypothetical protein